MATMPSSGAISMADIRRVFGPARSPGTVDYYGNYTPGPLRFPGPPGDINSYRNADNNELTGTSNMPSPYPGQELEMRDFYGKTCPVYGAYVVYSIYRYPAYSYNDANGTVINVPAEDVIVYPGNPLPPSISYDDYNLVTINVEGDVYTFTPTNDKVDWNYGWNYDYDPATNGWAYGPFSNQGYSNFQTYFPTDVGGIILLGFTADGRPPLPYSIGYDPPYFDPYGNVNYFETNIVYRYTGIVGTTQEWQYAGTYTVSAGFVRNLYAVHRQN